MKFLSKREIFRTKDELYITRYYLIWTKFFGTYIHNLHISDFPVPHDHPWCFITIPIWRGYREYFSDGTSIWRRPFVPAFRTAREYHWLELDKGPAWTIFIRFKAYRTWGFLTKNGWVDNKTYNSEAGLDG